MEKIRMLMDLPDLHRIYQFKPTGILHLGAHTAEEAPMYMQNFGPVPVWWVEANPRMIPVITRRLRRFPSQRVLQSLIYEEDGVELPFNVTNMGGLSSSILEFGTHTSFSPEIRFVEKVTLPTRTVDSLVEEHGIVANFLNMDLQGAELHAIKGATKFLRGVDYILTEVNKAEVYKGCARVQQLDKYFKAYGLNRVKTFWVGDQGWGDALYVRKGMSVRYN
jgi:FkbM family methyltransferase